MKFYNKIVNLANKLDKLGFIEEANELDKLIKFAIGLGPCKCKCDRCKNARNAIGLGALQLIKSHCCNPETGCLAHENPSSW